MKKYNCHNKINFLLLFYNCYFITIIIIYTNDNEISIIFRTNNFYHRHKYYMYTIQYITSHLLNLRFSSFQYNPSAILTTLWNQYLRVDISVSELSRIILLSLNVQEFAKHRELWSSTEKAFSTWWSVGSRINIIRVERMQHSLTFAKHKNKSFAFSIKYQAVWIAARVEPWQPSLKC